MKKQFSNLDELIQFIEISPFEEVDEFLKSHGVISQEPEKDVELLLFGEKMKGVWKMSKNPEAHIKKALDSLYNAIQSDYEEKYADWLKNTFKEYEHLNIKNPEEYSLLKSITLDEQAYLLAQEATSHLEIDEKKRHKILFVYLLYDFIERHLEKFIMEHEGVIYSTDKTRWLINTYVEYLVYEKVPVIDGEEFWHPMHLEIMDWINWIDSMSELYYGDEKMYIAAKEKLVECYLKDSNMGDRNGNRNF